MVWGWLTHEMKSDLGSPRWSERGQGEHDWFNGDCQRGNENWMEFSVCLNPHHMMLQVFSHVNKGDGDFLQMKCQNRKDKKGGGGAESESVWALKEQSFVFFFFCHLANWDNIRRIIIVHNLPTSLSNLAACVLIIFDCLLEGVYLLSLSKKESIYRLHMQYIIAWWGQWIRY